MIQQYNNMSNLMPNSIDKQAEGQLGPEPLILPMPRNIAGVAIEAFLDDRNHGLDESVEMLPMDLLLELDLPDDVGDAIYSRYERFVDSSTEILPSDDEDTEDEEFDEYSEPSEPNNQGLYFDWPIILRDDEGVPYRVSTQVISVAIFDPVLASYDIERDVTERMKITAIDPTDPEYKKYTNTISVEDVEADLENSPLAVVSNKLKLAKEDMGREVYKGGGRGDGEITGYSDYIVPIGHSNKTLHISETLDYVNPNSRDHAYDVGLNIYDEDDERLDSLYVAHSTAADKARAEIAGGRQAVVIDNKDQIAKILERFIQTTRLPDASDETIRSLFRELATKTQ